MTKISEITFAGRSLKVAPPLFSEDVCELVELFERAAQINRANEGKDKSDQQPFYENGKMLRIIRHVAKDCLIRGGQSDSEAEEIILSVVMDDKADNGIPALVAALGLN